MRAVSIPRAFLISCFFASCVTYGDVPVTGRSLDVSRADIQAALAADSEPTVKPVEIEVVSHDQINLYFSHRFSHNTANHHVIKRVDGKWRYSTDILVTE
jgi:hypothetical protein